MKTLYKKICIFTLFFCIAILTGCSQKPFYESTSVSLPDDRYTMVPEGTEDNSKKKGKKAFPEEKTSSPDFKTWGFANEKFDKKTGKEGYYVAADDLGYLFRNLTEAERKLILDHYYDEDGNAKPWGGSCLGMSTVAALVHDGVLSLETIKVPEEKGLQGIKKITAEYESIINFYQLQQYLPRVQNCITDFSKRDAKEQLAALEKMAVSGCPVIINIMWREYDQVDPENGHGYAHCVVGYGMEEIDPFVLDVKTDKKVKLKGNAFSDPELDAQTVYTKKIKIYDPNYPKHIKSLYYNDDGAWFYDGNGNNSLLRSTTNGIDFKSNNNNAQFLSAVVNPEYMSTVNYFTESNGDSTYNDSTSAYMACFICPEGEYDITTSSGTATVKNLSITKSTYASGDILIGSTCEGPTDTIAIYVPQNEASYKIKSKQPMDILFYAGNSLFDVNSDKAGTFEFSSNGSMSVTCTKKPKNCSIEITSNGDKPFGAENCNTIEIGQRGSKTMSITPSSQGFVVKGADMSSVNVTGYVDGAEQNIKVKGNKADSVLLSISGDNISIKGDENGDGSFEKVEAEKTIKHDVYSVKLKNRTAKCTGKDIGIGKATVKGKKNAMVTYIYYADAECTQEVREHRNAGTYYVKAYLIDDVGGFVESNVATLKIKKGTPTCKLTKGVYSFKETSLKKAAQEKKLAYSAYSGKLTFEKISGNKKITIDNSGNITVGKGLKKGTYKVKVKITAKADRNFKKAEFTKTIKIRVK